MNWVLVTRIGLAVWLAVGLATAFVGVWNEDDNRRWRFDVAAWILYMERS